MDLIQKSPYLKVGQLSSVGGSVRLVDCPSGGKEKSRMYVQCSRFSGGWLTWFRVLMGKLVLWLPAANESSQQLTSCSNRYCSTADIHQQEEENMSSWKNFFKKENFSDWETTSTSLEKKNPQIRKCLRAPQNLYPGLLVKILSCRKPFCKDCWEVAVFFKCLNPSKK